jgi:hypothetical protein
MGLGKDRGARFEENCLSIPMSGMQPEPQGRSHPQSFQNPGLNGNDCGCRSESRTTRLLQLSFLLALLLALPLLAQAPTGSHHLDDVRISQDLIWSSGEHHRA